MTAAILSFAEARKRKIIRDAKIAMRGLIYSDPLTAWYSMGLLSLTEHKTASFSEVGDPNNWALPADLIELPSDTEPA